jgi:CheY-like chemotaxis protein
MTMLGSPGHQPTSRRPRVLLADDNAAVCRAVERLLSPWCDITGCVPSSPALFDAVLEREPDVILLDFSLPGGLSGVEVCRRLKTMAPGVPVVAFSGSIDPALAHLATQAGASAFVWKLRSPDDLWPTIKAVIASTS